MMQLLYMLLNILKKSLKLCLKHEPNEHFLYCQIPIIVNATKLFYTSKNRHKFYFSFTTKF